MIKYLEKNEHKMTNVCSSISAAKIGEGGIYRSFIEIPVDAPFSIIFRDKDNNETVLVDAVSFAENKCKCVAMIKVRLRSDADGIVEPPKEEDLDI